MTAFRHTSILACAFAVLAHQDTRAQDVRGYAITLEPIEFMAGHWYGTVHLYVDGATEVARPFIREFGFGADTLWLTNTVQVDDDPEMLLKAYTGNLHLAPGPTVTGAVFYVGPRLPGIVNVPNSDGTIINIQSLVIISPLTGILCTLPLASNYQSNVTELDGIYNWIPGLVDPDGDSLAIELIPCVPNGYWLPPQTQIDPLTGELTIAPELPGAYAFCMQIRKWRHWGPPGSDNVSTTGTTYLEILIDVTNTVGIAEAPGGDEFRAFPNPAGNQVSITTNAPADVVVQDALGRTVWNGWVRGRTTVDASAWPPGMYTLRHTHGVVRIIVEH